MWVRVRIRIGGWDSVRVRVRAMVRARVVGEACVGDRWGVGCG